MAVFLPSDTSSIHYEETNLASLRSKPSHFVCGVYLICRKPDTSALCVG